MASLRSLATVEEWTVSRTSRRRRWRGKVLGSFLQQRWHVTGGSRRVGEVVGMGNFIEYRGKEVLRTYQGLEGGEASSEAKSPGSRWSETDPSPKFCRRTDRSGRG
jgi:primase-polymerase (primpol)-like protein